MTYQAPLAGKIKKKKKNSDSACFAFRRARCCDGIDEKNKTRCLKTKKKWIWGVKRGVGSICVLFTQNVFTLSRLCRRSACLSISPLHSTHLTVSFLLSPNYICFFSTSPFLFPAFNTFVSVSLLLYSLSVSLSHTHTRTHTHTHSLSQQVKVMVTRLVVRETMIGFKQ